MEPCRPTLVVASDQALVAETVSAAFRSRGFECTATPWPHGDDCARDLGLLICDLEPEQRIWDARALFLGSTCPWLVLTGAPAGPLWGAALSIGAAGVLPSTMGMDGVEAALLSLQAGRELHPESDLLRWRGEWRRRIEGQTSRAGMVASLTQRERAVARLLCDGATVGEMGTLLGITEATVRSHVKAVLRKLGVRSQVAAAAVLLHQAEPSAACATLHVPSQRTPDADEGAGGRSGGDPMI